MCKLNQRDKIRDIRKYWRNFDTVISERFIVSWDVLTCLRYEIYQNSQNVDLNLRNHKLKQVIVVIKIFIA
jgi:hypothetical protein